MRLGIREIIFMAAMLGLLGAAYFLGFKQNDEKRRVKQDQIDAKMQALADLERSTASVRDVNKKIEELQKATAFFERKLPQAKMIDKVLKKVWKLAEANGLQTKTVKTVKTQRMSGYSEQPIEMTLSGDFNGYYEFLLQLEKLPRLTRVSQMSLTKITDRDGEMQAQMTLSIFFEPDTEPGASPAGTDAVTVAGTDEDDALTE